MRDTREDGQSPLIVRGSARASVTSATGVRCDRRRLPLGPSCAQGKYPIFIGRCTRRSTLLKFPHPEALAQRQQQLQATFDELAARRHAAEGVQVAQPALLEPGGS
jgi:hypothetical protein